VVPGSVLATPDQASRFFRCAPVGCAATPAEGVFDGVELGTDDWGLEPLDVDEARSSCFDDPVRFPTGTVTLDSAFLTAQLTTTWRPQPQLLASEAAVGLMALSLVPAAGVEVCNRILDVCTGGGEASGWSGLYRAPLWEWTIEQETA
jgi:hypothetical protein